MDWNPFFPLFHRFRRLGLLARIESISGRASMNFRFIAATLAGCQIALCSPSSGLARDNWGVLSPGEKRVYHSCLYATFINDYCRFHAWGSSEGAFRECVIANGAGRIRNGFPYWGPGITDACRARAHPF
jgi:hypothetical protein